MNARATMIHRQGVLALTLCLSVALAGCDSDAAGPDATPAGFAESRDLNGGSDAGNGGSGALERGTYYVDPDADPSTPMRVHFTIAADGWKPPMGDWPGVAKEAGADQGDLLVTMTTVTNVAEDGCTDPVAADPPIGPGVDDLADALAALSPFEVTSPPSDVTAFGYEGKHLELTVTDAIVGCVDGNAFSWIGAAFGEDPFFGYGLDDTVEELWILDVEGTRLMIAAMRRPGSTPQDLAELEAILDSIRIEV